MLIYTTSPLSKEDAVDQQNRSRFMKAVGLKPEDHDSRDPQWPLPNLVEVKGDAFWEHLSCWSAPKLQAWVGRVTHEGKVYTGLVYFVDHSQYTNGGFVVLVERSHAKSPDGSTKVFRWCACEHQFERKVIGNCLNRYTCAKCGEYHDVDSSG
jgi:hypothetical protein